MRFVDLALSPIAVDHGSAMRRDAPRDPFARSADYEDRADFSTLFYDCHWTADDSAITCIGPRLGSLAAFLER